MVVEHPCSDKEEDSDGFVGPPIHLMTLAKIADDQLETTTDGGIDPSLLKVKSFQGHAKTVSCLALDPSGSRLISGGYDYEVKFWDFAGMDASFRSFRTIEPCGDYPIHALDFSITGDTFLIASGSAQPKLYDREGHFISEYSKGDSYIRDLRHTKGHVAGLTTIQWHPILKGIFMTASADSSIRIWDAEKTLQHKDIIVVKPKIGAGRINVSAASYSRDGTMIASVCQDGILRIFPSKGPYQRPSLEMPAAHAPNSDASHVAFAKNNNLLATRGGDDTLKLWDVRALKAPIWAITQLPNFHSETGCDFSPDDSLIVTGTSVRKNEGHGKLVFAHCESGKTVHEQALETSSVVSVIWHKGINQIIAGQYNGHMSVLYDDERSVKGAKLSLAKGTREKKVTDYTSIGPIITPHSLPLFQSVSANPKRQKEKARKDPILSHRPDLPMQGPGRAGKIGSNVTQHVVKHMMADRRRDEDPREALLKYAKEAEENPLWTAAYKKTQPKPIFQEETEEHTKKNKSKGFIPEAEYRQLHKRPKSDDWQ